MATKIGSSPILRLGTWGIGIVLAFMFFSWVLNDDELNQAEEKPKPANSTLSKKDAELVEKEKSVIANDVKQLFARFDQVSKQNIELKQQLEKFGKASTGQNSESAGQQLTADDIEALITREVNRRLAAQQSGTEVLEGSTSMNVGQSTEDALSEFESGGAGVGLGGYVVGGGKNPLKDDEKIEWVLPQDVAVEGGKTVFDGFFNKASEQLDFASDGTLNGGGNKKKTSIQYATIDKDAILYNAMVLNDLIGVVASGDTVQAPFKFKLEVSQENLATSGLYMPHVAMMRLSGYSRGEWATGCVEGIVTGATFVFEDGTISEISAGEEGKDGGNGNQIGYLSDIYGSPCIKGKKYSDLMEYAGISGGLTALAAAGDALASAQYSVQKSPDNVLQTFDGSLLSNAVGQGASQGINSINQVIATRYANVRDLVVAPAGQYVVMLSQQINIDYNPEGRKILNENFEEQLEAYHANKQSVVNP